MVQNRFNGSFVFVWGKRLEYCEYKVAPNNNLANLAKAIRLLYCPKKRWQFWWHDKKI